MRGKTKAVVSSRRVMKVNSLLQFARKEPMDLIARRIVQPDTVHNTLSASLLQGHVQVDVKMDGLALIVVNLM